ncbi:multidrug ABC transporter permease [Planomonospora sphaerica]|uniref:Multidrug ABC transporter permease n=1 Tax=Planomonospora sphaerica TaxID=161355 RepID=A0A171CL20_9ACTN|nr:ABC transporter ATP-binding protein [Planomonospora sphaerica]GAT66871.1 multidrug ABC transporter permease [Planomonospora sphaerica]
MPYLTAAVALLWRAAPRVAAGQLATIVLLASAPVVTAWLTKLILDGLAAGVPWPRLTWYAAGLAGAGLLGAVSVQADRYLGAETERRVSLLSRRRLHEAVNRFAGLGRFEEPRFHDRLRLAQESSRMAGGTIVRSAAGLARAALVSGAFLGSMLTISTPLTALTLFAVLPAAAAERVLNRSRIAMMWRISPAVRRDLFYSQVLTDVRAAKEVRLFGIGGFLLERMLGERRSADAAERERDRREAWTQSLLTALSALVAAGGLVWAVGAAHDGRLTIGDLSLYLAAVAMVQNALSQIVTECSTVQRALLLFRHYVDVVGMEPDLPAADRPAPELRRGIELRDVWFRYSPEHPWVLRGVDLFIPHGRATAVVGRNGEGKSTLVKLLCRFYDPERGRILWDGVDLRDLSPETLRSRIGAVFQDFMEYDLPAAENIGLGDLGALHDRERVTAAARLAGAHEAISELPRGYDTMLSRMFGPPGEEDDTVGVPLSGGQWQRLALARALLRDRRDLLILDEPSAGLDAEAEHRVHTTLREHRAGRTSLLISHRMGAIRDADRIVVLAGGRVAEQGDHSELMALGGDYAELFALQAEGYRPGPVGESA